MTPSPEDAMDTAGSFDPAAIAREYEIDGDVIRPMQKRGWWPLYLPAGYRHLAIDLVNLVSEPVPVNVEDFVPRAKEFSENWGLMGAPLGERRPRTEGTVHDLWMTARFASAVMSVVEKGTSEVEETQFLEAQEYVNSVVMEEASFALGGAITNRSRSFQWTYRFRTLRAVAFWHLGNYAIGEDRVGRCLECGKKFERSDRRQKFCPPLYHDGYGRRQSQCGLKHRQRNLRDSRR
jgi:hypothetical protein